MNTEEREEEEIQKISFWDRMKKFAQNPLCELMIIFGELTIIVTSIFG